MLSSLFRAAAVLIALTMASVTFATDLVIGQVTSFQDPLGPGSQMKKGAQAYFDSVNAAGGVRGAKLKLVAMDRGLKDTDAIDKTRELLKESNPLALIGFTGTGPMEALVKQGVFLEAGIPLVGIRSGATSLHQPVNPYLFHVRANYASEVERIIEQLSSTGSRRIAVFYENTQFGREGLANAEKFLKSVKGELVASASHEQSTTNVESAVKVIAAAKPQAVIMITITAASAEFFRRLRAEGIQVPVFALSTTDGPQVVARIGKHAALGLAITQVTPDPGSTALAVVREFQENFRKYGPKEVEHNSSELEGYLAAKVLVEGIRRAGPNPTRQKLRDSLESINDFDVGGMRFGFTSKNHSGTRYVDIAIINRQGRLLR